MSDSEKMSPLPPPRQPKSRRGIPLQERLFRALEERLRDGEFANGAAFPSEETLVQMFGVSRVTVRAALARLEQDGRIRRTRGRGTTVISFKPSEPPRLSLTDVLNDMDNVARATVVSLVAFDYRPAPTEVCQMLGIAPYEPCQYAIRLRSADSRVLLHITTYVPETIGRLWTETDLATTSLQSLLRRFGIFPESGQQVVTATAAGPAVAERLGVAMGAPLLRFQRSYFGSGGQPLQYLDALGAADRFDLRMSLRLTKPGYTEPGTALNQ